MPAPADRLHTLLEEPSPPLDRLLAVVASVASDAPTEDEVTTELDRLASELGPDRSVEGVLSHVHGTLGFVGNAADYYNPANSLVHRVLRHRRGIPLSLAAVAVEIGRRVDVGLTVVGLPGHVVVGCPGRSVWFDPFAGGAELDIDACRRIFARFHPISSFDERLLAPISPAAVTVRTLNNLKVAYRGRGDLAQLVKVLELAVAVPGSAPSERHELATVLADLGRDEQAAAQRDRLADLEPDRADAHRAVARRHRARRN